MDFAVLLTLEPQYMCNAIPFCKQMIFIMKWEPLLGKKLQRLEISIFDQYPNLNNYFQ